MKSKNFYVQTWNNADWYNLQLTNWLLTNRPQLADYLNCNSQTGWNTAHSSQITRPETRYLEIVGFAFYELATCRFAFSSHSLTKIAPGNCFDVNLPDLQQIMNNDFQENQANVEKLLRGFFKGTLCRFENLPIYSSSYRNNTLEILRS